LSALAPTLTVVRDIRLVAYTEAAARVLHAVMGGDRGHFS
jgi:hypothetical protein